MKPKNASADDEFIPQNALENALISAVGDTSARADFVRLLTESDLVLATHNQSTASDEHVEEAEQDVMILQVSRADGLSLPALFTSVARAEHAFGPGIGHILMRGHLALDAVAASGAVLNPGSPYGVMWSPADLMAILGQLDL